MDESLEELQGHSPLLRICEALESIVCTCGFIENLLVVILLVKNRTQLKIHHFYVLSLALSDLCVTLWVLNFFFLVFLRRSYLKEFGLLHILGSSASSYSIVAITCDRYWAISHVFHYRENSSRRIAKGVVFLVWTVAIGLTLTTYILVALDSPFSKSFFRFVFYFQIIAVNPFLILATIFLYLKIYRVIRESHELSSSRFSVTTKMIEILKTPVSSQDYESSQLKTTILLFIAVSCFVLCWLPFTLAAMVHSFFQVRLAGEVYFFLGFVFVLYSTLNPFIYAFRIEFVKKDLRQLWRRLTCGCQEELQSPSTSASCS